MAAAVTAYLGLRFGIAQYVHKQERNEISRRFVDEGFDRLGQSFTEEFARTTILAGEPRTTTSWRNLVDAPADEVKEGASVLNLRSVALVPGATVPLGEAVVTLVAGWPRWDGPGPTPSERLNAIRLEHSWVQRSSGRR